MEGSNPQREAITLHGQPMHHAGGEAGNKATHPSHHWVLTQPVVGSLVTIDFNYYHC